MKRMSRLLIVIVIDALRHGRRTAQMKPNPPDLNALAAKGEALTEAARWLSCSATENRTRLGADSISGWPSPKWTPRRDQKGQNRKLAGVDEQSGFVVAVSFSLIRNRNAKLVAIGVHQTV